MAIDKAFINIPQDKPILLFDGVCNLCNSTVKTIIRIDKHSKLRLSSLQSESGQQLLKKFNLPQKELSTIVLIDKEEAYLRSDVPLEIMRLLGGAWVLLYGFKIIPRFIRDWVYGLVANNRYKWFGKQDACMIPTPNTQQRFLT